MDAVDLISGTVLWDLIIHKVYDDLVVLRQYLINDCNIMFDVYEIGTMRECKNYIKERIDID